MRCCVWGCECGLWHEIRRSVAHQRSGSEEAVDNAREAARRAGMSVGQWLNTVILDSAVMADDDEDDVYGDPYAPPAVRRQTRDDRSGVDISAITDRLEGLTGEVERLALAAKASRDDVPKYDATAQRLADASRQARSAGGKFHG